MSNCEFFQDNISSYIDNELDAQTMAFMQNHIKVCDSCKNELEFMLSIINTLKNTKKIDVPDDFANNLRKRIIEEDNKQMSKIIINPFSKKMLSYSVAIAACIMLAIGIRAFTVNKIQPTEIKVGVVQTATPSSGGIPEKKQDNEKTTRANDMPVATIAPTVDNATPNPQYTSKPTTEKQPSTEYTQPTQTQAPTEDRQPTQTQAPTITPTPKQPAIIIVTQAPSVVSKQASNFDTVTNPTSAPALSDAPIYSIQATDETSQIPIETISPDINPSTAGQKFAIAKAPMPSNSMRLINIKVSSRDDFIKKLKSELALIEFDGNIYIKNSDYDKFAKITSDNNATISADVIITDNSNSKDVFDCFEIKIEE